jgi:hypothetical protein
MTVVTTQDELDAALADEACTLITIGSSEGVWLRLSASGSATVEASDSATVKAYGSATVKAYDSATVSAYDSATVSASDYVAIYLHSASATVSGGVIIDISSLDLTNPDTWANFHGVQITDGQAILYKATSANLTTGQHQYGPPTVWTVGTETAAPDWADNDARGAELHVSPRPGQARRYRPDGETGTRYLKVSVPLDGLRPLGPDKAKARAVRVLAEVDVNGNEVTR